MSDITNKLHTLRWQIDAIDEKLVELLNQRANICIEVGRIKKSDPNHVIEIKDEQREHDILTKITAQNKGPLNDEQLIELFNCMMAQSRDLQATQS